MIELQENTAAKEIKAFQMNRRVPTRAAMDSPSELHFT